MKRILSSILVVLLSILLPLQSMVFASGDVVKEQQSRKGMLIKYKPLQNLSSNSISLFSEEEQSQLVNIADSAISNDLKTIAEDTYLMNMSDEQITSMQNDENVEYIEEDSSIRMSEDKISWNVDKICAPILHSNGYYGKGIKVAIFDTGIDLSNKDLNVVGGVSFVEGNNSYNDDNGHGTAMASILASLRNDDGYVGVAPEINLYSVKILDKNGEGKYSNLIQGVQWAIDNGINIIAISCGGTKYSSILKYAMNNAVNHNILVVAASGNEGSTQINYPASYNDVICVGAVDNQNKTAPFSNTGAEMDLVAPGVGVEATCLNNLSMTIDGTSTAVPHVVGVAAQLWGAKPELTSIQMKALLYKSAIPIGERKIYGWGLVNADIGLQCINTDLQLPIEYEYPNPNAGGDSEGEGEIHASAIIVSGDGQHIQPGQSATVVLAFDKYHPSCTITTTNSSGTVLRTETKPVYGNYVDYSIHTTYTCPAGVMNSPGTYYIDFWCPDAPSFHFTFTIYVVSPPVQNDDHGNSISSATMFSPNSSIGGNINYAGDNDYFGFYAASSGNYTIGTSGTTDTYGSLYSSNGSIIASNDDNNGTNFSITQNLSGGQYYYVMVRHFNPTGTGAYTLNITYTKSVTGVSLDRSSMSLNAGGSTGSLTATVYPTDAANKAVTWSSSNNSVATVSSSGVVTPIGGGSAIITVCTNDGGYSASCTVTVTGLNISNVAHTSIVADSATISWNTNMSSDSIVEYGTTTSLGLSKESSTQLTIHSIQLTGLSKGTTYYYRVKSKLNTLTATSSIYSFTTLGYDAQITTNYPPSLNIGENNDVISGNKIANCSSFYPNAKVSIQNKGIAWTSNDEIYLVVNTSGVPGILFGSLDASGKPQYQGTQAMFKVNNSNIKEIILIAKADNDVTASSNKIWTQLYDKKANKYFGNKVETSISINTLGQDSFLYMRDDISANTSFSSNYNRFLDTNGTSHIAHRCFILPERGRSFAPKSSNVSYETTTEGNLYKVKVKFKWDTDIGTKYSMFKNNLPAFLVNNKYIKFISTVHMPIDWRWVSYDTNLPKGYNTHNIDFNIDGATSGSVYTSDHLECEVWTENPEKLVSGKEYYVTYTFSAKAGKTPKKGNFMQAFSIGADSSPMDADTEAYYEHGILLDTVYYSDTFYHNPEKIRNSIEKDNGEKRKRGIKVACPVIVHVYDSQGRHLGPSEDGSLELGIPGALYEVVDGETYILLDDNDTYEIRIEGYDNGMMNIKDEIIRISEDAPIVESSTVFKNIPVQENLQASYTIQPSQKSTSINIDSNGDGREDLVENADVIVDSSAENDRTAPTTNYDVSGTVGENNWYTSDVVLTLSASDNGGAAVAETSYIIDDGNQNTYYTPISISQEGSHSLKIGSVDTQRNVETQKLLSINIDKTAPDITISAPRNPIFGDEYILNFEAFDEVSGIASCSATIDGVDAFNNETIVLSKKDTVIRVVSTDNAGNTSEKAITIHVDDDVPPMSTVALKGTLGENLWYISDVIVTLDSTDIGFEGVDKTYYKINGAEPKEYTEPISITKEGSNLLEIYSVDKAGNMEEIKTEFIRIDKSLPIITEKRPEGTTYVKNIDGSYYFIDGISGVNRMEYSLSKSSTTPTSYNETLDTSEADAQGGKWYLFIRAYDIAGNQTQEVFEYNIDNSAPTIGVNIKTMDWTNKDICITPIIDDDEAGITNIKYCWTINPEYLGNWCDYTDGTASQLSDGIWYLVIRAEDKVGNTITKSFGPYKLDKTASNVVMDNTSNKWTNQPVSVTPNISDELSGVRNIFYAWNTEATVPSEWTEIADSTSLTQQKTGAWYLFVKVVDIAGNESIERFGTYNIDKILPIVSIDNNDSDWTNMDVRVNPNFVDDGGSGIKNSYFSWSEDDKNPGVWQTYLGSVILKSDNGIWYLHLKTEDFAGNENQAVYGPFKIDKTAPFTNAEPSNTEWKNEGTSVKISFKDEGNSGIKYTQYAISSIDFPEQWTNITGEAVSIDENGEWYLFLKACDIAGNITVNKYGPFKIDKLSPDINVDINTSGWTNKTIKVTTNIIEIHSGIELAQFSITNSSEHSGNWIDLGEDSISIEKDGIWYIHIKAIDAAGNQSVKVYGPYKIDNLSPSILVEQSNRDWSDEDIAVTPKFDDNGDSQLKYTSYKWSNGKETPANWEVYLSGPLTQTNNGSWYLHLRAEDNAGNVVTMVYGPYRLDKNIPNAEAAVLEAEDATRSLGTQTMVDNAKNKITQAISITNKILSDDLRENLLKRIAIIKFEIDIAQGEIYVKAAEDSIVYMTSSALINVAQLKYSAALEYVNSLPSCDEKDAFIGRLQSVLSVITDATLRSIKVQMYNGNIQDKNNTLFPRFKITNTGKDSINLSDIKIRYYYTIDGEKKQNFWCDWSNIGANNITGSFVRLETPLGDQDYYFELGFYSKAGKIKPGESVEVHIRIAKIDWSDYTQTNDYSFNSSKQNKYVDWSKISAYIGTRFAWGTPSTSNPIKKEMALKVQMYNSSTKDKVNTISPRFKICNSGTEDIRLSDIKIRYYYTIDGENEQNYWCDWSDIGAEKITGKFKKIEQPESNANYYFELSFTNDSGILAAGQSVEVHLRLAKTNWTDYTQSNDYSFNSSNKNEYLDWDKVSAYAGSTLVWGKP